MAMMSTARVETRQEQPAPIDLVSLAANTLGNRDLEREVLRMFRAQTSSMMSRIDQEASAAVRKDLVHTLKGSARAIGASHVAAACEDLEAVLEKGDAPDFRPLVSAVEEVNAYIGSLLNA
ncbi:Hpt domain-containing protein [Roseibium suaedae]|uniref:HPt (Histidine-containing phosphotransfer) domain-containing protein n=1 Tax=Roseibium suaedae TaxID=735517 RepID=A0A1M7GKW9_9HYPH|nr:Hpt domain-containing protein [Roseibium suaedae]SHM16778.1 HPt (histidine-containing phosphotransfer) domain-containing protein [Roseibium suaedae]